VVRRCGERGWRRVEWGCGGEVLQGGSFHRKKVGPIFAVTDTNWKSKPPEVGPKLKKLF